MSSFRIGGVLLLAVAGCDPQYPGEPVGTFEVTGHLEENTCGELAVPASDPLKFAVEIRRRGAEAFWRRPGREAVSGSARDDGSYRFRTLARVPVIAPDPDPDFGHAGCTLIQTEVVEVTLTVLDGADGATPPDGGVTEMTLGGTNTVDLVPEPGSDCTPATVVGGGPFLVLPCALRYTLEGEPRAGF